MIKKRYPGAKNADGVWQRIISEIPYHTRRFSFFAGTAAVELKLNPCDFVWLNDLNPEIISFLQENAAPGTVITSVPALTLLYKNVFTRGDFIYLDPPYIDESRRSLKKLYRFEMMDPKEHRKLLTRIRDIADAYIMISTKQSTLYEEMLWDWRKVEINTIDRSGKAYKEVIYMNYPDGLVLNKYDHIGTDYIERQSINRMVTNLIGKIDRLPDHKKQLYIKAVVDAAPDLAQHFLYRRSMVKDNAGV